MTGSYELSEDSHPPARELTILAETITAEEIDGAVLNRLMIEISSNPQSTKQRLGLNEAQLAEVFVTLSNAQSFINDSEMANVRAMCAAWNSSAAEGEARIAQAIAAYTDRAQLTKNFIAKYYSLVLTEIEASLDEASRPLLDAYMDDRRRRMAQSGATTRRSPVQNISAGTDTINFHCR